MPKIRWALDQKKHHVTAWRGRWVYTDTVLRAITKLTLPILAEIHRQSIDISLVDHSSQSLNRHPASVTS